MRDTNDRNTWMTWKCSETYDKAPKIYGKSYKSLLTYQEMTALKAREYREIGAAKME